MCGRDAREQQVIMNINLYVNKLLKCCCSNSMLNYHFMCVDVPTAGRTFIKWWMVMNGDVALHWWWCCGWSLLEWLEMMGWCFCFFCFGDDTFDNLLQTTLSYSGCYLAQPLRLPNFQKVKKLKVKLSKQYKPREGLKWDMTRPIFPQWGTILPLSFVLCELINDFIHW